ncbi:MAG: hypothetical protein ACD_49C00009G0054 [uncultured bacterium (gcode 4)]|uniref:Protein-export membrane protein SecG n=1 Tax=uncultured bacterium (gcode 4) TaxID=1234023 RepID=K2BX93_9BACT|nr:MAG: hypothetical protein ACD_49C00009G0054 [uncultured bacterium (gcode 4)]
MLEILKITQIVISLLLAFIILIQPKKSSLSLTTFWSESAGKYEKRWPEKILHNATIIFWVLFVINALLFFFLA